MPVIKVSLTDEAFEKLTNMANAKNCTVQDLIRNKVLGEEMTVFDAADAVQRVFAKYDEGDVFTLPEIYGEAWACMRNGIAGVFGKRFNHYVAENCPDKIMDLREKRDNKHQLYKLVSK